MALSDFGPDIQEDFDFTLERYNEGHGTMVPTLLPDGTVEVRHQSDNNRVVYSFDDFPNEFENDLIQHRRYMRGNGGTPFPWERS